LCLCGDGAVIGGRHRHLMPTRCRLSPTRCTSVATSLRTTCTTTAVHLQSRLRWVGSPLKLSTQLRCLLRHHRGQALVKVSMRSQTRPTTQSQCPSTRTIPLRMTLALAKRDAAMSRRPAVLSSWTRISTCRNRERNIPSVTHGLSCPHVTDNRNCSSATNCFVWNQLQANMHSAIHKSLINCITNCST
jgi:hypothetical protein